MRHAAFPKQYKHNNTEISPPKINIASLNIQRGLLNSAKEAEIINLMRNHKLDIFFLNETDIDKDIATEQFKIEECDIYLPNLEENFIARNIAVINRNLKVSEEKYLQIDYIPFIAILVQNQNKKI